MASVKRRRGDWHARRRCLWYSSHAASSACGNSRRACPPRPPTWPRTSPMQDAPARVLEHLESQHGRLDLLVNNAGAAWRARFADGGYENVRRTMAINFDAQVRLTEALLALLRRSAPSAIVNVSSTAGRVTRPGTGAYSASKFALAGWSDALAAEEHSHGVHVGLVLPGFVSTEGFPADGADRANLDSLGGLNAREGGRGDPPGRHRTAGRTLRTPRLRRCSERCARSRPGWSAGR